VDEQGSLQISRALLSLVHMCVFNGISHLRAVCMWRGGGDSLVCHGSAVGDVC